MSQLLSCGLAALVTSTLIMAPAPARAAPSAPHAKNEATQVAPGAHFKSLPEQALTITSPTGASHLFHVEIAIRPADQERGLMYRKALAAQHGMLFIWPAPRVADMWMRNTFVPLDIVFIDENHKISAIAEDTVPLSEAFISGHGPSIAVLELPAHTTALSGIKVGDSVSTDAFGKKGA